MEESGKKDEISAEEPPVEPEQPPLASATVTSPEGDTKGIKEPNEAFFGSLLIFCLALSLIAATGYFGIAGYRYFKETQAEKAIPSIESLPKSDVPTAAKEEEKAPEQTAAETPAPTEPAAAVDKKTLVIKVLNGGSAKGVAGSYGEKLKQAGFIKTTVGNAFGDYTGQTLYYAKSQLAAANVIKEEILKTYSSLIVKEASTGDKDATAATFVLILGR